MTDRDLRHLLGTEYANEMLNDKMTVSMSMGIEFEICNKGISQGYLG
jgi:hypothetical protein